MKAADYFSKCRAVGSAVWLLNLYWVLSKPARFPWFVVNDGRQVLDSEVSDYLGVSVHTVVRWRSRLLRAGLIKVEGTQKTRILVQRALFTVISVSPSISAPGPDDWPKLETHLVQ